MSVRTYPIPGREFGERVIVGRNGQHTCASWEEWGGPDPKLAEVFDDDRVRAVCGLWLVHLRIACGSVDAQTYARCENRLRWRSLKDLAEGDFIQTVVDVQRKANDFVLSGDGLPAAVRTNTRLLQLEELARRETS